MAERNVVASWQRIPIGFLVKTVAQFIENLHGTANNLVDLVFEIETSLFASLFVFIGVHSWLMFVPAQPVELAPV